MNGLVSFHGDVKRILEDANCYTVCSKLKRTNGLPRAKSVTHCVMNLFSSEQP
jgi:hypothetical protein